MGYASIGHGEVISSQFNLEARMEGLEITVSLNV
jgi:hypothetical protein